VASGADCAKFTKPRRPRNHAGLRAIQQLMEAYLSYEQDQGLAVV
jgi:hypothetical protein